jgi:predicted Rossmann fold flavoprotein
MAMELAVIGGGASGMMAAISAKRILGDAANVVILERLEKVGKKILATGNGKCNLSNTGLVGHRYNNPDFVMESFRQFGYNETINFFESIGVLTKTDQEGRVYPFSEAATAVLDDLRAELKRLKIEERCNSDIRKITKNGDVFSIINSRGIRYDANAVVIAAGGKASPVLGSNGSSQQFFKGFDLKTSELFPGLNGIMVDQTLIKGLAGIRVKGVVTLFEKKMKIWEEAGEIQFKNDGLSGIVIMQAASVMGRMMLDRPHSNFSLSIDLWPEKTQDEVNEYLIDRANRFKDLTSDSFLVGLLNRTLGINLLRRAKIEIAGDVKGISPRELLRLGGLIKNLTYDIKSSYDFESAQVTVGGLEISEVNPKTFEVNKISGLYVCGEALNIDGECGGYNLQWAWTSGYIAGNGVALYLQNRISQLEKV